MYAPFPRLRFFEENPMYRFPGDKLKRFTLKEVQGGKEQILGEIRSYEDPLESISDYRLVFMRKGNKAIEIARITPEITGFEKTLSFAVDRKIRNVKVSPDGESFIAVFEGEAPNFYLWESSGEMRFYDTIYEELDYPDPDFGFLNNNTYYVGGIIGRLRDFGKEFEPIEGEFLPLTSGYFLFEDDSTTLELRRVLPEAHELEQKEIGKLPMYSNYVDPESLSKKELIKTLDDVRYGRNLNGMEKKNLDKLYFNEWLPEFGMKARKFQMAGDFIAGEYQTQSSITKPEILIWRVASLSDSETIPTEREVEGRENWVLLSNGQLAGIDIPVEGRVLQAYACCDAQRIHSHMISTTPIPKELVDITTGFL